MLTKNWYKCLVCSMWGVSGLKAITKSGGTSDASGDLGIEFNGSNTAYRAALKVIKGTSYYGVAFGDGTAEPTAEDIKLSGNEHTALTGTVSVSTAYDDNGATLTGLYTLTNTGNTDVTISEVGLFAGTGNSYQYLVERTLLASPITIAAGGIGTVTYTIRMNYPTA